MDNFWIRFQVNTKPKVSMKVRDKILFVIGIRKHRKALTKQRLGFVSIGLDLTIDSHRAPSNFNGSLLHIQDGERVCTSTLDISITTNSLIQLESSHRPSLHHSILRCIMVRLSERQESNVSSLLSPNHYLPKPLWCLLVLRRAFTPKLSSRHYALPKELSLVMDTNCPS